MWRLATNGADRHDFEWFVHVLENTKFTDAQLPDPVAMFPAWEELMQHLLVSSSSRRLMSELLTNGTHDSDTVEPSEVHQFGLCVFRDIN
jgi:hypothetical protein